MKKRKYVGFLVLSVFLLASIASGSHLIELCSDDCQEISSSDHHSEMSTLDHASSTEHEHNEDTSCPSNKHHCCHHSTAFYNNQFSYMLLNSLPQHEVSQIEMISDPHVRGLYQPPRA